MELENEARPKRNRIFSGVDLKIAKRKKIHQHTGFGQVHLRFARIPELKLMDE